MPDPWSTQHQPGLLSFLCCFQATWQFNLHHITAGEKRLRPGIKAFMVQNNFLLEKLQQNFFQAPAVNGTYL